MQILLTNDDGIFAPGLAAIYQELVKLGDVMVVAPSQSKSGASHSVTFSRTFTCEQVDVNGLFKGFSVQGSPADCVKLAVMKLCRKPVDLVVSGINSGANAGINVYYSGTVAAAMEAAFLEIPSVALSLSLEENMDYETAARYFYQIIKELMPLQNGSVININMPLLSRGRPKGIKVAPHSSKGFDESFVLHGNRDGKDIYELTGKGHKVEESHVDIKTLEDGYITITALTPDMTDRQRTSQLEDMLRDLNL